MLDIVCDKCGSKFVEVRDITVRQEPAPVKMSEWPQITTTLVHNVTTTKLTCKTCGYSLEKSH